MIAVVRFRLGMPQPSFITICDKACACGIRIPPDDAQGHHISNCRNASAYGWARRSKFVQLKLRDIALSAGLTATLEQVVGGEGDRTDVTISDWIQRDRDGSALSWPDGNIKRTRLHTDVAVINATAKSHVSRAAKIRGHAALQRARVKMRKYTPLVHPDSFTPAVLEAHGFIDKGFARLLSDIAESHIDLSQPCLEIAKEDRGIIKSHRLLTLSYQLISVALQRGIATHISIAAGRVNALHARSLAPFKSRGLSACGVQQILGLHDRNLLFGSQIPV